VISKLDVHPQMWEFPLVIFKIVFWWQFWYALSPSLQLGSLPPMKMGQSVMMHTSFLEIDGGTVVFHLWVFRCFPKKPGFTVV
jgi:hypothetical protein